MSAIKTTIEFAYEPSDLFEEPLSPPVKHGALRFEAGKATYVLDTPIEPVPDEIMREVKAEISGALQIREMLAHRASTLSEPTTTHDQAGGGKNRAIGVGTASMLVMGGNLDVVVTQGGKIIRDSKAERIKAHSDFLSALAPKIADPTVAKMVKSYQAAIRDPAKELSHLFEIIEAANHSIKGEPEAYKQLGFTKPEWDAITSPANNKEINQGRHTGRAIQGTRDATETELQEARNLAREIIKRYSARV